jgi:hypothetical protein
MDEIDLIIDEIIKGIAQWELAGKTNSYIMCIEHDLVSKLISNLEYAYDVELINTWFCCQITLTKKRFSLCA